MRIPDSSAPGNIDATNSKIEDASPASSASTKEASAQPGSGDIVSFGRGHALVQLAFKLGSASRQNRVAEVRSQLESGTYRVESQDVSRGILHEALLLSFQGSPTA